MKRGVPIGDSPRLRGAGSRALQSCAGPRSRCDWQKRGCVPPAMHPRSVPNAEAAPCRVRRPCSSLSYSRTSVSATPLSRYVCLRTRKQSTSFPTAEPIESDARRLEHATRSSREISQQSAVPPHFVTPNPARQQQLALQRWSLSPTIVSQAASTSTAALVAQ